MLLHLALRVFSPVAAQETLGVSVVGRKLDTLRPAVASGVVALDGRADGASDEGPRGGDTSGTTEEARPGWLLESGFWRALVPG